MAVVCVCPMALPPSSNGLERAMQQRRRFNQLLTLTERLDQEAARLRAKTKELPRGVERERFSRRARQVETAMQIDEWLASPGWRAPR
jgi:hypothetical protein